jgi:plasmid stabilization system protein ParE
MARYVLTDSAKADVRAIVVFLRERNPRIAKRVKQEFRAAMRRLAQFPGMGHLREDVTHEPVRFWSVYSYLIVYRPDTKPLEVIRVLHGARELSRLFQG